MDLRSHARGLRVVGAAGVLLTATAALALATSDTVMTAWRPFIDLWGRGDPKVASSTMHEFARAYSVVLNNATVDAATQEFLDDSFDQLRDFDLGALYRLLPEQKGDVRALHVRGDLGKDRYMVRRASASAPFEVTLRGSRRELGATSGALRAWPAAGYGGTKSYVLDAHAGAGVGKLNWSDAMVAQTDALRSLASIGASGPTPSIPESTRARVRELNPGLGPEDVEIISVAMEGFPSVVEALGKVIRMEDIRAEKTAQGYDHMLVRAKLTASRMQRYRHLASYARRLNELVWADIRWVDSKGRMVARGKIDTNLLSASLECYAKDGRLLPFTKDKVFDAEPIDPMGPALKQSKVIADARFELLGIAFKIDDMTADFTYDPKGSYASFGASVTKAPKVDVEGAALGIIPTGVLDMFIPGNMEGLAREFLDVAVRGNGNRGIVARAELGAPEPGTDAAVEVTGTMQALDNYLIRFGVGFVNDRLLPSEGAIEDGEKLASDLHAAFLRDLKRFDGIISHPM